MYGFTSEQLLGENVTEVFSEEDQPKVEQQMSLMRNRQGGVTFEEHFIFAEGQTRVSCFVTILAMVNIREIGSELKRKVARLSPMKLRIAKQRNVWRAK